MELNTWQDLGGKSVPSPLPSVCCVTPWHSCPAQGDTNLQDSATFQELVPWAGNNGDIIPEPGYRGHGLSSGFAFEVDGGIDSGCHLLSQVLHVTMDGGGSWKGVVRGLPQVTIYLPPPCTHSAPPARSAGGPVLPRLLPHMCICPCLPPALPEAAAPGPLWHGAGMGMGTAPQRSEGPYQPLCPTLLCLNTPHAALVTRHCS